VRGPQALAQLVVGHEPPRAVPGGGEVADEVARGLLGERVEGDARAGVPNGLGRVRGPCGQLTQELAAALAVAVTGITRPLVVQPREELAVGEGKRVLEPPGRGLLLEGQRVDPGTAQPDRLPRGLEVVVGRVTERAAHGGQGGAQAGAGALLEHVGPEGAGKLGARPRARVEGEPGQQRSRLRGRGRLAPPSVGLQAQLPNQAHTQHRDASLTPGRALSRSAHEPMTVAWESGPMKRSTKPARRQNRASAR
jgi:hypothetical protein